MEIQMPKSEYYDTMNGAERITIKLNEHGMISLIDCMPRNAPKGSTGDYAIVQAARVSYGDGTKKVSENRGLIRYLYRHKHFTPFEMVEFKLHCVMPIFIARQWIRHRTASVNEYSARYSIVPDRFYRPDNNDIKKQSALNKQGGGDESIKDEMTLNDFEKYLDNVEKNYEEYNNLISKGVAREQARIGLPQNIHTEWYWKCDLRNIFNFLSLRMDSHAQKEIRDYAYAMYELIKPIVPYSCEAFEDFQLNSMTLSRLEIEAIQNRSEKINTTNSREQSEWEEKKKKLNINSKKSWDVLDYNVFEEDKNEN
jgi:thymidylate synthase (FAD)